MENDGLTGGQTDLEEAPSAAGAGLEPAAGAASGGEGQPAGPTLQDIMKRLDSVQPHIGRMPDLLSKFDTLPKTVESLVQKQFQNYQQQQYLQQLTPEQRQQLQGQQYEQQQVKQLINDAIKELLPNELSWIQETAQRSKDRFESEDFRDRIEEAVGAENMPKVGPIVGELLKEFQTKMRSFDPAEAQAARQWYQRALQAPEGVALQAMRRLQEQVLEQGGQLNQQRQTMGRQLQGAPAGSRPSAPKSLKGMSPAQLEELAGSMPTEEFEKLVVASRGR